MKAAPERRERTGFSERNIPKCAILKFQVRKYVQLGQVTRQAENDDFAGFDGGASVLLPLKASEAWRALRMRTLSESEGVLIPKPRLVRKT